MNGGDLMATVDVELMHLADLVVGRAGVCFAVLVKRDVKLTKKNDPYYDCHFRANHALRVARVWANHECSEFVKDCRVGVAYRLTAMGDPPQFGTDLKLLKIELAGPEHASEGFCLSDLIPSSDYPASKLVEDLRETINSFHDEHLRALVKSLLNIHRDLFMKMPAAKSFHHAYNAGLLEHVWSLTKVCSFLADHYGNYYRQLDPPLNKDLILSAAIVHDIGKLIELSYDPFDASYTVAGQLIGHVVIGRDMVRDAAKKIDGFPEETLMLLEHAILAHHGKREWGAPILPKTLEAMIVSVADDLDAKMNAAARALIHSRTPEPFTEPVKPLEGRCLYKGIPQEAPSADGVGPNGAGID
jgi:3'-5' exoribonuclease